MTVRTTTPCSSSSARVSTRCWPTCVGCAMLPKRFRRPTGPSEASVAHSLLTGRFAAPAAAEPSAGPAPSALTAADRAPGSSTLSAGGSEADYYRGIARVGVQVADALAYAHRQGILHRDIKPSNLLLDQQGTVWVTDFGLAKAEGADDLTQTGDIVGTLRFMAPERFDGQSLPQSDVYALGVTLYELLTLRPAFDDANKARLVETVLHEPPHAAAEARPAHSARPGDGGAQVPGQGPGGALRPVRRRWPRTCGVSWRIGRSVRGGASGAERFWRWCRRNPAIAGSLAAVGALAAAGYGRGLDLCLPGRGRARGRPSIDRDKARDAEREGRQKLFEAYLAEAKANRLSRRPGTTVRHAGPRRRGGGPGARAGHSGGTIGGAAPGGGHGAGDARPAAPLSRRGAGGTRVLRSERRPEQDSSGGAGHEHARRPLRGQRKRSCSACRRPSTGSIAFFGPRGRHIVRCSGDKGYPVEVWRVDGPQPRLLRSDRFPVHSDSIRFRSDGSILALRGTARGDRDLGS